MIDSEIKNGEYFNESEEVLISPFWTPTKPQLNQKEVINMENNNTDILNKEVGTKEIETLKAVDVTIKGINVIDVFKRGSETEVVGKKLVLSCKHPDREELIKISQIKFLKGEVVKTSTIWVNMDSDDQLQKGSTVDMILKMFKVTKLSEGLEKTLPTDLDAAGYLCIKAY